MIFKYLLDMPKTIYFNFKVLPFLKAIRFPFYVSRRFKLDLPRASLCRRNIIIPDNANTFSIRFCNSGSENVIPNKYGLIALKDTGKIIFGNKIKFSAGCTIRVDSGVLRIGNNFSANRNCEFSCTNGLTFGDNVLLAFRIGFRDNDGHKVIGGEKRNTNSSIVIGNHVWICGDVDILKGVIIGSHCVVAFRSLVLKGQYDDNTLIAGSPAKIISRDITWEF